MRVTKEKSPRGVSAMSITVVSSDDISILSDDELNNKFSAIKRRIDQGRKKSVPAEVIHSLEVEHCYMSREITIRSNRRHSHDTFISKTRPHGGRNYNRYERN